MVFMSGSYGIIIMWNTIKDLDSKKQDSLVANNRTNSGSFNPSHTSPPPPPQKRLLLIDPKEKVVNQISFLSSPFIYLVMSGLSCSMWDVHVAWEIYFFLFDGCGMWDLVSRPEIEPWVPCIGSVAS